MGAGDRTKKMMARELKTMCTSTPLRKITVSDIVAHCEINRGTFYYHFQDKQELINYVYHVDVTVPLRKQILKGPACWDTLTLISLELLYDSPEFYMQALQMDGPNKMASHIEKEVKENWQIISRLYVKLVFGDVPANYSYLYYISDYFACGAVSMLKNWILGGMKENPAQVAKLLDLASNEGLGRALDHLVKVSKP